MTNAGLSKLGEISLALQRFRASGKLISRWAKVYDQAQYYLAAQADRFI